MKTFIVILFLTAIILTNAIANANSTINDFDDAKRFLNKNIELFDSKTIYCSCLVKGKTVDLKSCGYKIQSDAKRASRLEWEHVVPAEAFGQSFKEWHSGSPRCHKKGKAFKGRKCAETNPEFAKIEGDVYNLFPEIGELNGLRSNYSMAQIESSGRDFGACRVKLADRKFEPQDSSKGIVARTYMNLNAKYPGRGIVSDKNKRLFEVWNKKYPLTKLECKRIKALKHAAGYEHLFQKECEHGAD